MIKREFITDLYQFTTASVYCEEGIAEDEVAFNVFFRSSPFKNQRWLIACGIDEAVKFIREYSLNEKDVSELNDHLLKHGLQKLHDSFIEFVKKIPKLQYKITAYPVSEGTVVYPEEPILTIVGPRALIQLLESTILLIINHQTLIATKANRIVRAAKGRPVIEFGLRRAQGDDAAIKGSRAAYIGGCVGTSNVAASMLYDIPVFGTHPHAFVMSFEDEINAFKAYNKAFPNTTLLVDTYNTLEGVKNAIRISKLFNKISGIRIDSGDIAQLSKDARILLDDNNLRDVKIIASNDLNEEKISTLLDQDAKIDMFGVGTDLITARPQAALGGVYKLVMDGQTPKMKLSSDKITYPGLKAIQRSPSKKNDIICLKNEEVVDGYYVSEYHPSRLTEIRDRRQIEVKNFSEQTVTISPKLLELESKCRSDLYKRSK